MSDRVDINRLLLEMRTIKSQTQAFSQIDPMIQADRVGATNKLAALQEDRATGPSFGDMFSQAIGKVNETQQHSASLAKAYETGDPNVDITQVMVASQKASVSFQAMVQVRNKLIDAYRDVMNMPI